MPVHFPVLKEDPGKHQRSGKPIAAGGRSPSIATERSMPINGPMAKKVVVLAEPILRSASTDIHLLPQNPFFAEGFKQNMANT